MVDWCHVALCLVVSWFSVRSSVGKVVFFFVNAALCKNKIGYDVRDLRLLYSRVFAFCSLK